MGGLGERCRRSCKCLSDMIHHMSGLNLHCMGRNTRLLQLEYYPTPTHYRRSILLPVSIPIDGIFEGISRIDSDW